MLQRDPSDLDARLAAVQAAVDCNDLAQAGTLARDALVIGPQDPRAWLAAAAVHRARGAGQAALADLRQASSLRRQQLGTDNNAMINYVIETDTPTSDNPFRTDPVQQGITASDPGPDDIDGLGAGPGVAAAVAFGAMGFVATLPGLVVLLFLRHRSADPHAVAGRSPVQRREVIAGGASRA